MEDFNNDLNEKHNYEVYTDKASKFLTFSIVLLVLSLISYLFALLGFDNFDFGFIFELFAFICVVIAKNALIDKKLSLSKKTIIASMCSLGWLLVYDFIDFFVNINEIMQEVEQYYLSADNQLYYLTPYLVDVALIALIVILYKAFSAISYADGTKKHEDYSDSFYDKL